MRKESIASWNVESHKCAFPRLAAVVSWTILFQITKIQVSNLKPSGVCNHDGDGSSHDSGNSRWKKAQLMLNCFPHNFQKPELKAPPKDYLWQDNECKKNLEFSSMTTTSKTYIKQKGSSGRTGVGQEIRNSFWNTLDMNTWKRICTHAHNVGNIDRTCR